jgi:hypothetical protein
MKRIGVFLVFLFFATNIFGYDGIKVELQFFTQTYRLNEPIPVLVNVVNTSYTPFDFYVSPMIYETFFFSVKTPRNEDIKLNDRFRILMDEQYSPSEDFRKIILAPGESFSREIDITRWFEIKEAGYYVIKGIFYPNPDIRRHPFESINYKILVRPPAEVEERVADEEAHRITRLAEIKKLPPYDAIADMIDAKMRKDWERFLAHIDTERLIMSFQNFAEEYRSARTGRYRLDVINRFERYLTVHWQDRILSYEVRRTEIERERATVTADVEFRVRQFSYVLRYDFMLYQNHEGQWLVYDYTVTRIR